MAVGVQHFLEVISHKKYTQKSFRKDDAKAEKLIELLVIQTYE